VKLLPGFEKGVYPGSMRQSGRKLRGHLFKIGIASEATQSIAPQKENGLRRRRKRSSPMTLLDHECRGSPPGAIRPSLHTYTPFPTKKAQESRVPIAHASVPKVHE